MSKGMTVTAEEKDWKAKEAKWRVESDLRTLLEARTIQKDKARMTAARKLAREQAAELTSLKT